MSYYTAKELLSLGIKSCGINVLISSHTKLYNPQNMTIGNNVRIDDFCILTSVEKQFIIEDYVHIAAGVYIFGAGGVTIESFSGISSNVKIYTCSDDFSGNYLMGPTIPCKFTNVKCNHLTLSRYTIIGTSCVILPGVKIGEGAAVGANSLINKKCEPWGIYAGSPIKYVKQRTKKLLEMETELLNQAKLS